MKTTVELSDPLLREAKRVAARDRTTLRALLEAGLARELRSRREEKAFRLRDATFKGGRGLQSGYEGESWARILEVSYKGRGA
jgi:hypothetical protein